MTRQQCEECGQSGLSLEQRAEFDQQGFLRLRGAFSIEAAAAMEDLIWEALGRKHGVRRDDRATWQIPMANGLQPLRMHDVFRPIGGPILVQAIDALMGVGKWEKPKHWGPFFVTFPQKHRSVERPRPIWHSDFPFSLPVQPMQAVAVLSYLCRVPPGNGGTLALAGSHRLVGRFIKENPEFRNAKMKVTSHAFMKSEPQLVALGTEAYAIEHTDRLPGPVHTIGDHSIRVVELTGEPGDVVITHPWLFHSPWPNHGNSPRFMRIQGIHGADATPSTHGVPPTHV